MTAALAYSPSTAPPRKVALRPAPRREPPFDDEIDDGTALHGGLDLRLPFDLVRPAPRAWRAAPTRDSELPDPAVWARRLLIGLVETAGGRRPLHQLAALLSPSVHRGVAGEFERSNRRGGPHWLHRASVRTVRSCEPCDGIAELCAVLETGQRVRALAMRLEQHHGRWRCIRLQIG